MGIPQSKQFSAKNENPAVDRRSTSTRLDSCENAVSLQNDNQKKTPADVRERLEQVLPSIPRPPEKPSSTVRKWPRTIIIPEPASETKLPEQNQAQSESPLITAGSYANNSTEIHSERFHDDQFISIFSSPVLEEDIEANEASREQTQRFFPHRPQIKQRVEIQSPFRSKADGLLSPLVPRPPLEEHVKSPFKREFSSSPEKKQFSANLIMKQTTDVVSFKERVTEYDWEVNLSDFKGATDWLLKIPEGEIVEISLDYLVPKERQLRHQQIVLNILNQVNKPKGINWNELAYMLSRPIAIEHPIKKVNVYVEIEMEYNKEASAALELIEGRKCVCMSTTITQGSLEEYQRKREHSLFIMNGVSQRTRAIGFLPLLDTPSTLEASSLPSL